MLELEKGGPAKAKVRHSALHALTRIARAVSRLAKAQTQLDRLNESIREAEASRIQLDAEAGAVIEEFQAARTAQDAERAHSTLSTTEARRLQAEVDRLRAAFRRYEEMDVVLRDRRGYDERKLAIVRRQHKRLVGEARTIATFVAQVEICKLNCFLLTQKVGRIRSALAIDVSASLPEAIKQANKAMGLDDRGSLPEQATRLVEALGLPLSSTPE